MEWRHKFRRTTILACGLAAFLLGLGIAKTGVGIGGAWAGSALILLLFCRHRSRVVVMSVVLFLGFTAGWWRGSVFIQRVNVYEDYYDQVVTITGMAETDAVYDDRAQLTFDMSRLQIEDAEQISMVGRIKVQGFGAPAVYRGDVVQVQGKLRSTLGSRQGRISFAELTVLGRSDSLSEDIRHRFVAGMQTALPEPMGSFGLGLLVGQRNTLPEDVSRELSVVGLTHLIAVSGYNLTILVRGARRTLQKRSKFQSFMFSVALIGTFLLFTGFSPSIIRAAIVSLLSLWAWYYGRSFRPSLLLLLSAALTAGVNPLYVWSDIGWYLSFLAFFGVLILAPLLISRLYKPTKRPGIIGTLILESICAQIMTMPLILYIFKEVSLISLLANVLVVPLVPVAMLTSLVAGIAGMLLPAFAGWLAWPAALVLTYMLDVVHVLAKIPHALVNRTINLAFMLCMYVVAGFVSIVLWRRLERKNAILTENKIVKNGAI